MDESNSPQSGYLLPGGVYDILKWLALIALPAVAWLVGVVGPQMGTAALRRTRYDHQRDRFVRRRAHRREPVTSVKADEDCQ